MKHITGIGRIFFKANDPEKLGEWYRKHLGLEVEEYGGVSFHENDPSNQDPPLQCSGNPKNQGPKPKQT
jgi:hypothetical protein